MCEEREEETVVTQRMEKLLKVKFPNLTVLTIDCADQTPTLHLFKPFRRKVNMDGIEHLPTFHVLIQPVLEKGEGGNAVQMRMRLYSYHGKKLLEECVSLDSVENRETKIGLLEDLENDNLQLCRGVQDLRTEALDMFFKTLNLPLMEKVKSLFLIECFHNETLLRSRLCNFVVFNALPPDHPDVSDYARCSECEAFNHQRSLTFFTFLKKFKDTEIKEFNNFSHEMNVLNEMVNEVDFSAFENVFDAVDEKERKLSKCLRAFQTMSQFGMFSKSDDEQVDYLDDAKSIHSRDADSTHEAKEFAVATEPQLTDSQSQDVKVEVKLETAEDCDNGIGKKTGDVQVPLPDRTRSDRMDRQKQLSEERRKRRRKKENKKRELDRQCGIRRKWYPKTYRKPCPICLHQYSAPSLIAKCVMRHEEELNLDVPVRCPNCYIELESKRVITQHFSDHHKDTGRTCCCECLLIMPNENNRLRRHFIKKHHTAGKPEICSQCGKSLPTARELKLHMEDHESNGAICHECGKVFQSRKLMVHHIGRHHNRRDLKCPYCEKLFVNRQQVRKHLAMHTGMKPYKCPECKYCAYQTTNVHTHVSKTHGKKGGNANIVIDEEECEKMNQMIKVDVDRMFQTRKQQSGL